MNEALLTLSTLCALTCAIVVYVHHRRRVLCLERKVSQLKRTLRHLQQRRHDATVTVAAEAANEGSPLDGRLGS